LFVAINFFGSERNWFTLAAVERQHMDNNKRVAVNQIPTKVAAKQTLLKLAKAKPWYRRRAVAGVVVGVVILLAVGWSLRSLFSNAITDNYPQPVISTQPMPTTEPHGPVLPNQAIPLDTNPDPSETAPFRFNPRTP
jgi:negative regulator of sigma E activity